MLHEQCLAKKTMLCFPTSMWRHAHLPLHQLTPDIALHEHFQLNSFIHSWFKENKSVYTHYSFVRQLSIHTTLLGSDRRLLPTDLVSKKSYCFLRKHIKLIKDVTTLCHKFLVESVHNSHLTRIICNPVTSFIKDVSAHALFCLQLLYFWSNSFLKRM